MNAAHESELAENELHCLRRDRERYPATDGFKWSSEKKVKLNSIAVAKGQKVLEKIASETEKIESPFELISTPAQRSRPMETPFASQVRPPLGDVTNSGFRSSSSLYAADGKRKAEDISFSPSNLSPSFARGNRASMASAQVTPLVRRSTGRLGSSARRPLLQPGSPVASSSTPSKPPTNAAAGPRISLGMTPGRLHSGNVPRFTTPFKDPSRVGVASTSKEKIPDRMLLSSRGISAPSVMKVDHITRATKQVFNLDKTGLERLSLDDMFDPESTYLNQTTSRLTLDDCDTIRQILNKPSKGRQYAFAVEGKLCGFGSAHVMIQDAADMTVPRAWVENHYTQILWKLAAYTRHVLDDRYWNWNEVCRQIKYRYEREVNQKQRPALMQIMRRGRMPNRGIVLCVMEIPQFKLGPDAEQVLVLTDGWYKIKARLDGVLSMAVYGRDAEEEHRLAVNAKIRGEQTEQNQVEVLTNKIRIKVGSKLCIQGCGYESELETVEPIKGFESCRLLLGGNQVKLARWDAKLGFAGAPFISTIRSLSAGGGSIGLMDLVVTRIYPVAFSGAETCPDYRNTEVTEWGFEEEEERRKVWERHRARTKKEIIKEQEEEIAVYKRIYEQLDQACEGLSNGSYDDGTPSVDSASCQDLLEAMITAGNASAGVRLTSLLPTLRQLAGQRLEREMERVSGSILKMMDSRVGTREVKSFRLVRARDATNEDYGRVIDESIKRINSKRTALIKIWDYAERCQQGCDVPKELGDHLLVSNLTPATTKGWPRYDYAGDVELSCGRHSRWQKAKVIVQEED